MEAGLVLMALASLTVKRRNEVSKAPRDPDGAPLMNQTEPHSRIALMDRVRNDAERMQQRRGLPYENRERACGASPISNAPPASRR